MQSSQRSTHEAVMQDQGNIAACGLHGAAGRQAGRHLCGLCRPSLTAPATPVAGLPCQFHAECGRPNTQQPGRWQLRWTGQHGSSSTQRLYSQPLVHSRRACMHTGHSIGAMMCWGLQCIMTALEALSCLSARCTQQVTTASTPPGLTVNMQDRAMCWHCPFPPPFEHVNP